MRLLLFFILFFCGPVAFAQQELQKDSSVVGSRSFNNDAIQKLRQIKSFIREFQEAAFKPVGQVLELVLGKGECNSSH
jgi:hypothetical protein